WPGKIDRFHPRDCLSDLCDLLRNFESFLPDEARIMRVSNFCEKDSSSFHGVRRERRSPRNPPRQETPRNILNRRSQRSLRGKHPHFLHEYTTHQACRKNSYTGIFLSGGTDALTTASYEK